MPELPEVECLTRAVASAAEGRRLTSATFYRDDLRDPIPIKEFKRHLEGQTLKKISRRSKYMIWHAGDHCALFHLGMSGNMLEFPSATPQRKHTHAVFTIEDTGGTTARYLHFIDPRRFGRINYCASTALANHDYFSELGPEPLLCDDLGDHLYEQSRGRKAPVKNFLMDARNVVGVGNIYASESLFRAKIRPQRKAQSIKKTQYLELAVHIKQVLSQAILSGGTSFRDYQHTDGSDGGFELQLAVYGRAKKACLACKTLIKECRLAGRSSFYCPSCQR